MSPLKSDSSFNISVFDMNGQYVCVCMWKDSFLCVFVIAL